MKQRPILFSTAMVQAILAGRKTQTRRTINPQPITSDNQWKWEGTRPKAKYATGAISAGGPGATPKGCSYLASANPYGQPGDVLWVRETFQKLPLGGYTYKAAEEAKPYICAEKWKPSIHMPKEAARIWLQITNVRVERLQDISEEDAKSEGVELSPESWKHYKDYFHKTQFVFRMELAKSSFETLWWSINGKESWDANPWVWVVEFKRINKPQL